MPIVVDIDVMLARRKMPSARWPSGRHHAGQPRRAQERPGQGGPLHHPRGLCEVLECQPGDLLRREPDRAAA